MIDSIMNQLSRNSEWTWRRLEDTLHVVPLSRSLLMREMLSNTASIVGHELPLSYVYFVQKWGAGLAFGMFRIWVPIGNPGWDIQILNPSYKELLRDTVVNGMWPTSLTELAGRVLPFGDSVNGDLLCWDPENKTPDGEMAIHLLSNEQDEAPMVGSSLVDFLGEYCVEAKLDETFPVGGGLKWNLPLSFDRYSQLHNT